MLELDGPLGKVDLERTLDGGRSCLALSQDELFAGCVLAESTFIGAWGDVGYKTPVYTPSGALSRRPWPVIISADIRELAELCLRYDNDESPFAVDVGL